MPSSNRYSIFVSIAASVGGVLFGYEIAVINQVFLLKSFKSYFNLENSARRYDDATGNVVMSFLIGCMLGAMMLAFIADLLGRKRSIWLGSILFSLAGISQAFSINLWMLLAGRLIAGFGVGILSMTVPLYISEISPTAIRGRMTSLNQLMITIGIALANIVNAILRVSFEESNHLNWRIAFGLQSVPSVILLVGSIFLPYSPRWLLLRDRPVEALNVLAKLRGDTMQSGMVQREFWQIKESVDEEVMRGRKLKYLLKPGILNRVVIASCLQFFQQWSGINAVMYYSSRLFQGFGFDAKTAAVINTVIGSIVNVVGTLPGLYFIERAGRRKCLIVGGIVMSISMWGLVAVMNVYFSKAYQQQVFSIDKLNAGDIGLWVAIGGSCLIYLYTAAFAMSWGPVVWVYQSEIFPIHVRGAATSIATLSNWTNNAILAKVWPYAQTYLEGNQYIVFGITTLLSVIYVKYFVVETRNCSLEEVGFLFNQGKGQDYGTKYDRSYLQDSLGRIQRNQNQMEIHPELGRNERPYGFETSYWK
ncbi:general substrate transporter [Paraphysoderma sedebokerense]|nr:general substrate transporter [Paraphysoderma sedebokerense]